MLSAKRIRDQHHDYICRRCINKIYRVRLKQDQCKYGYFYRCPVCGEDHHMVVGFKGAGKLKMFFRF